MARLLSILSGEAQRLALGALTVLGRVYPANRRSGTFVSDAEPAILGGSGRCGTTLLRVMLDSHGRFSCGPESDLFLDKPFFPFGPKSDFFRDKRVFLELLARNFDIPLAEVARLFHQARSRAEFADLFFRLYCESTGKPRWAEKSPDNLLNLEFIRAAFPRSKFIHILRDGRDVACSFRTHPRHVVRRGRLVPTHNWHPIRWCIGRWVQAVETARPYRGQPWYMEVKYEDLVASPRETMRRILDFLGEPWDENVLHFQDVPRDATRFPANVEAVGPLKQSAAGRWRRDFSDEDKRIFKEMAGPLLVEVGYETSDDW
ncbi:MAG: sulfotransferase [Planctomycetota bacterium]|nr:sulfotransferase [Planctomycetota bacterium]